MRFRPSLSLRHVITARVTSLLTRSPPEVTSLLRNSVPSVFSVVSIFVQGQLTTEGTENTEQGHRECV